MMGQQQQTVAEQAGDALRRMILVLAVAAFMAAMMVVMSGPAFADTGGNGKGFGDGRGGGDIFHQYNGNTENNGFLSNRVNRRHRLLYWHKLLFTTM